MSGRPISGRAENRLKKKKDINAESHKYDDPKKVQIKQLSKWIFKYTYQFQKIIIFN